MATAPKKKRCAINIKQKLEIIAEIGKGSHKGWLQTYSMLRNPPLMIFGEIKRKLSAILK